MKKIAALLIALLLSFAMLTTAFAANDDVLSSLWGTKLYVYNWGEYISDGTDGTLDVNREFEKRYGIEVIYDTFDNNEVMYSKVKGGGVNYDVVIPSDYMIARMISEDMLAPLDFDNIPNYDKYIDAKYKNPDYDPENLYSVPYNVGMVGLIYNTNVVTETPTSWRLMWNEDYKGQILMFANPRDAFAIAQSILGIDYNSEDPEDWQAAADLLKEQKKVYQGYVNDEIYDKMESGEAAIGAYYAGDYLTMLGNNPDLAFVYPEEGVNRFVDAACVLKDSKNKRAAELYINFLQEPEIALANAEVICYASPNTAVINDPDYEYYQNEILYPSEDNMPVTQTFLNLSPETLSLMSDLWESVKNYDPSGDKNTDNVSDPASDGVKKTTSGNTKTIISVSVVAVVLVAVIVVAVVRKKKKEANW